jgi:hypothetical protein
VIATSICILALIAVVAVLIQWGWANTAECIGVWWMREARRARQRERSRAADLNRRTVALLEAE